MTGAKLEVVANSHHALPLERPSALIAVLWKFLDANAAH